MSPFGKFLQKKKITTTTFNALQQSQKSIKPWRCAIIVAIDCD